MKPSILLSALSLTLLSSLTLLASPNYQLGEPVLIGNGCPKGSASVAVSPDGSAISILFDRFSVDAKRGMNPWDQMRKNCRFHIPVALPPGFALEAVQVDYRGFVNAQNGNRAFIITTGAFVGLGDMVVGNERTRSELRNVTDNFLVRQQIPTSNHSCKTDNSIDFSVFLQMFGYAPKAPLYYKEEASLILDSTDVGANEEAIRFQVRLTPCH